MDVENQGQGDVHQSSSRFRSRAKVWLIGGAGLIAALGLFWYFTGSNTSSTANQRRAAAAPVRVAAVTRRDMPVVEHTLGKVAANTMVQVTARVQGVLEAAHFKDGQFVKKGDLLFQIDPRPYAAALDQSRAILQRDQAQLKNANLNKQRIETLHEKGSASTQQLETSETNAEMLVGTIAADKAAVALAELNLGYTQIRSPVDGKTGPILIQPGNIISSGNTAPLVTIAQVQPVKVSFTLAQSNLPRIQSRQKTSAGLTASLDVHDAAGVSLMTPVDFTDNAVNAQSGTIELRATFSNADLALVPGQLVNVTVELDNLPNALTVPRDAVNDGPAGPYVYVVEDNKAVPHNVKILFDDSQDIALESDLKPGDRVIVEGQLRLLPNSPVNVQPLKGHTRGAADAPSGEAPQ
jgi:multidrug efflux system membrane fusion protein